MARTEQILKSVDRAIPLTPSDMHLVPKEPGVYAAWIAKPTALRHCGVAGPAPKLVYVGKAETGSNGLNARLRTHLKRPWYALAELLAVRGQVLFPWHARLLYAPGQAYSSRFKPGPLCQVSVAQTLAWQHRHLIWSWHRCPADQADALETAAVLVGRPLLNLAKLPWDAGPPQLRERRGYGKARSRWLWLISWAGMVAGEVGWLRARFVSEWELNDYQVDSFGYPLPASMWQGTRKTSRLAIWPPADELRRLLREAAIAAPADVRRALDEPIPLAELRIWWAGHYGATHKAGIEIVDAMRSSLSMDDDSHAPGPGVLPAPRLMDSLIGLEEGLGRVRH